MRPLRHGHSASLGIQGLLAITLERLYGFSRMRYRGIPKGTMELQLIGMTFNLKQAAAMVE